MDYYFLCNGFFEQYKSTEEIKTSIRNYIHNNYDVLKDIYFEPKKIGKEKIDEIMNSVEYQKVLLDTITHLNNTSLDIVFDNTVNELGNILNYRNIDKKVYIIIGMNTTTIYSTKYQNEDVTVILLESTLGIEDDTTIQWVKDNKETIDKIVENELDKNNMMYDFFYMFAKRKFLTC